MVGWLACVFALSGAASASAQAVVVDDETDVVVTDTGADDDVIVTTGADETDVVVTETETVRTAPAEPVEVEPAEQPHDARPRIGFVEATGAYGVNFGRTDYLPAGAPADWMHPIVLGYAFGATAGISLVPGVALIANYEYARSESREGSIDGAVESVQGSIDNHSIVGGARFYVPLPYGAIQAELALGVLLPFQTEVEVQYTGALAQLIGERGSRIDEYSVGFGGHALFGYMLPIGDVFYTSLNVKLRMFESENSGERRILNNYVTDYTTTPPTVVTGETRFGDGAAQPTTNSVQDIRLQLALGARF
ncbi:hypothetical protein [Sandaracinus amylolyticus]|uniref:Outer membrane protein beta-barrel domain-containing protein n=1 Tax=Sandaracinus amylolyticus TaxID=927083 RepID=A0A0F6SD78_9BACT|nr:hypothetical protein [Sandaracinus amylolyticus]AKF02969.1 hypothetical protein DB32_000117 [Sandaracinus amylolyticus]